MKPPLKAPEGVKGDDCDDSDRAETIDVGAILEMR